MLYYPEPDETASGDFFAQLSSRSSALSGWCPSLLRNGLSLAGNPQGPKDTQLDTDIKKAESASGDLDIKAAVKVTGCESAPAEVAIVPIEEPSVFVEVTGPATPAPAPAPKTICVREIAEVALHYSLIVLGRVVHVDQQVCALPLHIFLFAEQAETVSTLEQVPPASPAQAAEEAAGLAEAGAEDAQCESKTPGQADDLSIVPPNVQVTIKGMPAEGAKAVHDVKAVEDSAYVVPVCHPLVTLRVCCVPFAPKRMA
jgi:hypothetical protein